MKKLNKFYKWCEKHHIIIRDQDVELTHSRLLDVKLQIRSNITKEHNYVFPEPKYY